MSEIDKPGADGAAAGVISLDGAGDGALQIIAQLLWPQVGEARKMLRPLCEPWARAIQSELRRRRRRPDGEPVVLHIPEALPPHVLLVAVFLLGRFVLDIASNGPKLGAENPPAYAMESYIEAQALAGKLLAALRQFARGLQSEPAFPAAGIEQPAPTPPYVN